MCTPKVGVFIYLLLQIFVGSDLLSLSNCATKRINFNTTWVLFTSLRQYCIQ